MWSKWSAKAFLFGAGCGVDGAVRGGLLGRAWDEDGDGAGAGVGGACVGMGEAGMMCERSGCDSEKADSSGLKA